eukprot:9169195-Alexandrium_andersonii.AAC.1
MCIRDRSSRGQRGEGANRARLPPAAAASRASRSVGRLPVLLRVQLPEEPQQVLLNALILEGAAGRHVQQLDPL